MTSGDSDLLQHIKAPTRLADLDLTEGLALDLFMRRVFLERMTTVGGICAGLGIAHAVGDEIAEQLKERNLLQYHGIEGRDFRISLTEVGYTTVEQRLQSGRHAARMPISLQQYHNLVLSQRSTPLLNRETVKAAYADLVVEDATLDQIGPAFVSEGAVFFYGPPGTGKTSLAERTSRFWNDPVLIPHYIVVDGQLIGVFDPAIHEPVAQQPGELDPRLVLCKRPLVLVGGELTLSMMDLQYDSTSGLNVAPIQLLANNGILVVDDFGRQTASPEQLLNRWILPLSRGIDFLRPNSGTKFTVPFELKLVVSTNLEPAALGDDAFLRRLRNKVFVGACTENAFNWILVRAAAKSRLEVSSEAAEHLAGITIHHLGELRPYVAVDVCELAESMCRYDGLDRTLDGRLIDRVAELYFVRDQEGRIPAGPRFEPESLDPSDEWAQLQMQQGPEVGEIPGPLPLPPPPPNLNPR